MLDGFPPIEFLAGVEGFLDLLGSAFFGSRPDVVSFFRIQEMNSPFAGHLAF